MTVPGLRFENVAQVRTATSFGTGYHLAPGLVLTAAHVVGTADEVTVAGTRGRVVWLRHDNQADAALVAVPQEGTAAARFGAFVTTRPHRPVEAIGFPRLQKDADLRDQEHFAGELNPGTGALSQRYEITSATPLPMPPADPVRTPWAGMSGAAVFSKGLLVGVVRQDRRAATGARLTATPMATLLADDSFHAVVRDHTGVTPVVEPVELAPVLTSPYPQRDLRSVASLLRADARTVAFHDRDAECARLVAWCETADAVAAMIVTGPGGTGKTRLAQWLVERQRRHGWTTGIVTPGAPSSGLDAVTATRGPLLLAVDYAENQEQLVRDLLRQALPAAGPVRVLLLARGRGVWSEALREPDARVRDLLADAPECRLGALTGEPAGWDTAFRQAVHGLAAALPSVPGHADINWQAVAGAVTVPSAQTHQRPDTALGIQMTALTMLLEHGAGPAEPVERTLLRHEEAYWTQSAARLGLDALDLRTRREAVAALWLTTPADRDDGVAVLHRLGVRDADRGRVAARWLAELYPSEGGVWGAVQPDRIAEYLLAVVCAEESDLLARLVTGATGRSQARTLLRAVRAARSQLHFGNPAEHLLAQIERAAGLPVISDETLAWAVTNAMVLPGEGKLHDIQELPDGTLRIGGELDKAVAALAVVGHQRQADGLRRSDQRQAGFGYVLLSLTLGQLGRPAEALAATDQAIACFRADGGATEDVAVQLTRRAEILTVLERQAEAVDAVRESVALHATPDAFDMLIQHLVRLGRLPEAVGYADQEIALLRGLATNPRATAILGRALGRKGELLLELGAAPTATGPLTEASAIFDRLPAEYAPDRAKVLAARARGFDQTGDVAGTLAAWLAAAAIWRTQPGSDEDRVGLAQCLNNAAVCHIRLGDLPAALAMQAEAAEVATPLRAQRPDLYTTMYANLVRYQANSDPARAVATARALAAEVPLPSAIGWDLHRAAESLGTQGKFANAVEACELALRVAGDDVLLHAALLKEMSADLADLGRYAEGANAAAASARAWRAVLAHREPADTAPLRVNLATTLSNLATNLRAASRFDEAANVFAEAATELRPLATTQPELRPLLADVLHGEASAREETEDLAAAVPVLRELADLRRADPPNGLALARALLALARVLLKLHRTDEAFPCAAESVDVFHRLLGDEPPRYEPEYASAFFMTGMCLVYGDRPAEAVVPLARALGMAAAADDRATADSSMSALQVARSQNPRDVDAEWQRLTGFPFPGTT